MPVLRTLEKIGILRATFYHWYDLYRTGRPEALTTDRLCPAGRGHRIPTPIRDKLVRLALSVPSLQLVGCIEPELLRL